MTKSLEKEITSTVAKMDEQQNEQQETDKQTSPNVVQDIYVLIVRETEEEEEDQTQIVESTPAPETIHPQKTSLLPAYAICSLAIFLILSTITFQFSLLFNPPIATVTIIPKSQTVTLHGTVQLGRVLPALTLSQSQIVHTTGRGHQDARTATGTVTFFNGLFTQQFIASGTVYTGNDGVAIITTQDATIPEGSPSTGYGTVTVTAQALQKGTKGNIPAGDIAIAINNGLLVRNSQLYNGQDERTYTTVTQKDIHSVSTVLKSSLERSINVALAAQLRLSEALTHPLCSETVSPNHQVGDEAIQVKVTVSETCSAAAYDTQALTLRATQLLTNQADKNLAGYSVFGNIQVSVKQASVSSTQHPLVFLSYQAQGTWVYALSQTAQQQIKHLIAGKNIQQAAQLLASLPGVEHAAIRFTGIGDDTRLPKNRNFIHIILFVV